MGQTAARPSARELQEEYEVPYRSIHRGTMDRHPGESHAIRGEDYEKLMHKLQDGRGIQPLPDRSKFTQVAPITYAVPTNGYGMLQGPALQYRLDHQGLLDIARVLRRSDHEGTLLQFYKVDNGTVEAGEKEWFAERDIIEPLPIEDFAIPIQSVEGTLIEVIRYHPGLLTRLACQDESPPVEEQAQFDEVWSAVTQSPLQRSRKTTLIRANCSPIVIITSRDQNNILHYGIRPPNLSESGLKKLILRAYDMPDYTVGIIQWGRGVPKKMLEDTKYKLSNVPRVEISPALLRKTVEYLVEHGYKIE